MRLPYGRCTFQLKAAVRRCVGGTGDTIAIRLCICHQAQQAGAYMALNEASMGPIGGQTGCGGVLPEGGVVR